MEKKKDEEVEEAKDEEKEKDQAAEAHEEDTKTVPGSLKRVI